MLWQPSAMPRQPARCCFGVAARCAGALHGACARLLERAASDGRWEGMRPARSRIVSQRSKGCACRDSCPSRLHACSRTQCSFRSTRTRCCSPAVRSNHGGCVCTCVRAHECARARAWLCACKRVRAFRARAGCVYARMVSRVWTRSACLRAYMHALVLVLVRACESNVVLARLCVRGMHSCARLRSCTLGLHPIHPPSEMM